MIPFLIGGGIVLILIVWMISINNRLVSLKNNRESAFADIDVQLKQRYDLIPQLVGAVEGYMTHEKEVLTRVTEARSQCVNAGSIAEKISAESNLGNALNGLRVQLEAYPELKANANFLNLQSEISDIENKLAAVRRYFNSATKEYNNGIEQFPSNLIAGFKGYRTEPMFELSSDQRSQLDKAPEVKF